MPTAIFWLVVNRINVPEKMTLNYAIYKHKTILKIVHNELKRGKKSILVGQQCSVSLSKPEWRKFFKKTLILILEVQPHPNTYLKYEKKIRVLAHCDVKRCQQNSLIFKTISAQNQYDAMMVSKIFKVCWPGTLSFLE